jgi:hypothetical protein
MGEEIFRGDIGRGADKVLFPQFLRLGIGYGTFKIIALGVNGLIRSAAKSCGEAGGREEEQKAYDERNQGATVFPSANAIIALGKGGGKSKKRGTWGFDSFGKAVIPILPNGL